MSDITEIRLAAAREHLASILEGQAVQDALLDVAQALAQLGSQALAEKLDTLLNAVRINRRDAANAMRVYEDALADHLQTIVLAWAISQRQQDRRLDVLDTLVLGATPPPIDPQAHSPEQAPAISPDETPDDPTGTDAGAHPRG